MCLLFVGGQLYFTNTELWESGAKIVLGIGTAFLLQYLNRLYVLVKTKTVLPAFFWLLFLFAYTPVLQWTDMLLGLAFLLCLLLLFATYQQPASQQKALNMFIILSAASLIWYPALLLFFLIWIGMYRLQSLNLKTFMASLAGVFLVYLCLFTWSMYKNDFNIFLGFLPDWKSFIRFELPQLKISEYVFIGFQLVLYIVCLAGVFYPGRSDKVKTKTIFGYLTFLAGVLFVFFFLFVAWGNTWLSVLFVPLALLYSDFFAGIKKVLPVCLFLFVLLLFIAKLAVSILFPAY